MKRLLCLLSFICYLLSVSADDVVFRAEAPNKVVAGRPFQLTYSINQRARDLQAPEFNGFDYLAGPYTSQSSSTSFVNGRRTSSFSLTYTYTLMGTNPGDFTIGPATITCDGQKYTSNGVRITVLPPDEQPQQTRSSGNSGQSGNSGSSSTARTSGSDIFVRAIATKTTVYEQEALQLSYRLYVAGVDFAQMGNTIKLPECTGFMKQELELGERQFELEHYNGRNYQAVTLVSYLLYPQHSGDIQIEAAQFEAILREQSHRQARSIFDDFFGTYENVSRMLTAPAITIHVKGLPAGKPAGYSGGVGQFTLTPSISTTDVQANEAITLRLDIKGAGNMKLLKTPAVDWPEGFEPYDPKVTNNYKTSGSGYSGTKTIEYLAIPRAAGQYTIPAIAFSYFDIQAGQYKTLTTPEYTLNVRRAPGQAAGNEGEAAQTYTAVNKENIKELGTDIRYINTNEPATNLPPLKGDREGLYHLLPQSILLIDLVMLVLSLIIYFLFRKFRQENADITKVRYKRANKVAQKRLKTAQQLLSGDSQAFYAEIEKASFSYLSDRLSIPTADLTKDNIADLLQRKGVSDELIQQVHEVLSTAEFARYAPTTGAEKQALYDATTNMINQLENQKI
ncbi:MAG: BatD family protein [Paludibacteraceae bacterium]|nr:BatD family protein [Paludibacteraceae bacterium]